MVSGLLTRSETAILMPARERSSGRGRRTDVLVRHEPDYVLVTVAGEVDFASAAGLRERLFTLAWPAARWWPTWTG